MLQPITVMERRASDRPVSFKIKPSTMTGSVAKLMAMSSRAEGVTAIALEAAYLAPYLGRMQAKGIDALAHLNAMNMISQGSGCEVLAASIKSLETLRQVAQAGTPCATLSPDLACALFDNINSTEAHHAFEAACQSNK